MPTIYKLKRSESAPFLAKDMSEVPFQLYNFCKLLCKMPNPPLDRDQIGTALSSYRCSFCPFYTMEVTIEPQQVEVVYPAWGEKYNFLASGTLVDE